MRRRRRKILPIAIIFGLFAASGILVLAHPGLSGFRDNLLASIFSKVSTSKKPSHKGAPASGARAAIKSTAKSARLAGDQTSAYDDCFYSHGPWNKEYGTNGAGQSIGTSWFYNSNNFSVISKDVTVQVVLDGLPSGVTQQTLVAAINDAWNLWHTANPMIAGGALYRLQIIKQSTINPLIQEVRAAVNLGQGTFDPSKISGMPNHPTIYFGNPNDLVPDVDPTSGSAWVSWQNGTISQPFTARGTANAPFIIALNPSYPYSYQSTPEEDTCLTDQNHVDLTTLLAYTFGQLMGFGDSVAAAPNDWRVNDNIMHQWGGGSRAREASRER